jgi:hypothetical protein
MKRKTNIYETTFPGTLEIPRMLPLLPPHPILHHLLCEYF